MLALCSTMFWGGKRKKSCFAHGDRRARGMQFLFVVPVFNRLSQVNGIRPFLGKIQLLAVFDAVKFVTPTVTFVEMLRDDTVVTEHPMHAKAKILL